MRLLSRAVNSALTLAPGTAVLKPIRSQRASQWGFVDRFQLGVLGWDPVGHEIGKSKCGVFTSFDSFKQTLVGTVLKYSFYDGDSDEADWNIDVLPDPRYRFILEDVKAVMADLPPLFGSSLVIVDGKEAVQCEITPDENFYVNPYFERPTGISGLLTGAKSALVGKKIGLYGPWVRDFGHGGRPEIHPCELIWWLDRAGQRRTWTMLVVQDDSNRFDLKSNYSGPIDHPWSEVPRVAAFAIAARARVGMRNRYRLSVRRHRNMAVIGGPVSTIDEREYFVSAGFGRSRFPGTPAAAVTVERRIDRPRDIDPDERRADVKGGSVKGRLIPPFPDVHSPGMLDVQIDQVDAQPVNGAYRFFIYIQVQVGATNRGREGYAEIRLEELAPVPVIGKDVARIADRSLAVTNASASGARGS